MKKKWAWIFRLLCFSAL